jgi:hypothetical protein
MYIDYPNTNTRQRDSYIFFFSSSTPLRRASAARAIAASRAL